MEKENVAQEANLILLENEKLMKKSFRMIISFFSLFITCAVLFIVLQQNKFFIFNLNRTFNNVPSPFVAEMFSLIFIIIIIIGFFLYVVFAYQFIQRKNLSESEQIVSLDKFEKLYSAVDIFSIVPIFLLIVMVINGFFFSFAQVEGVSMQPTFCDNDAVIIKYVEEYQHDDIVILEQNDLYLIKRLVAVPGDKLVVNASGVYVNDILIEDNMGNFYIAYQELIIPDGYYFVLGDNRDNSEDSRMFGLKAKENMLGKVIYKISTNTCPIEW
ncbi:MAG: signal peptidase I [Tenericutes bacterium]|nr:signal peptidase I [Mycoplasmatota bacterium]